MDHCVCACFEALKIHLLSELIHVELSNVIIGLLKLRGKSCSLMHLMMQKCCFVHGRGLARSSLNHETSALVTWDCRRFVTCGKKL